MRKIQVLLLLLIFSKNVYSQNYTSYDTIRKNELAISILPALVAFSGYNPRGNYASYILSYKHYYKNKKVFRFSFSISPRLTNSLPNNGERFEKTIDTLNYFSNFTDQYSQKFQINIGFEKLFKINRLMHGFGCDLLANFQQYNIKKEYYWFPTSVTNGPDRYNYSHGGLLGHINNGVDSSSYSYKQNRLGFGFQVFYSLRYKINTHFYVSSTIGPYINFIRTSYTDQSGNKKLYDHNPGMAISGTFIISDISLAYRF